MPLMLCDGPQKRDLTTRTGRPSRSAPCCIAA
jgi:hypothetical protein